jgi:hypothetical protein
VGRWRSLWWPAGIAAGVAAEWTRFGWHGLSRWLPGLLVGWIFIACVLVASARRPQSRSAGLLAATGVAWFLPKVGGLGSGLMGRAAAGTLFWQRRALVHLVLTHPGRRTGSRLMRSAVLVGATGRRPRIRCGGTTAPTTPLAASLVAAALWRYRVAIGPARRLAASPCGWGAF